MKKSCAYCNRDTFQDHNPDVHDLAAAKKTFRCSDVFLLQPLIPAFCVSEHISGKWYKRHKIRLRFSLRYKTLIPRRPFHFMHQVQRCLAEYLKSDVIFRRMNPYPRICNAAD